ncbi:murein DD-endopeptidase MepM/ murein hydrolase activator NlpD [Gillisia mitskevichiae]|uniref:Murein DD-endopeptidase MepM/ murein hydrolase activator NlpD n=1 Tax=Gillisia mitskevichiae TaxID=270921 RepID=A0A495PY78_9FLAO|nr:M23 family metallopeptidase [Gillisia mitskevichiae]RKS55406.1 murein DD-endopeptidase MepM/ murein hydrolase activator NlpD [Gillisia mitskevichiae]
MSQTKENKKKFTKKLLHKYRLVVLNEDTFEERLSFKLTKLNLFVAITSSAILLIALTTFIIAFTGLREYIPGYSSTKLKRQATELTYKTDSLQTALMLNNQFYESIRKVLTGDLEIGDLNRDSILNTQRIDSEYIDLSPSRADSLLREEVALEDKYNVLQTAGSDIEFVLFPPVKGPITEAYNIKTRHYAIDIVVAKNAPVKSVADGRVIFAEWSAETGYVMIIEHNYGLLSVYKHNSSLTKEQGDFVRSGEVVAAAGSAGELTTGPHLHFELWNEGNPVNPQDYIDFD